jgi:hypothetical protein
MSITRALDALGIINFKLEGDPTTEEEFNTAFVKITGADSDGVAIESTDPDDFEVTWAQIQDAVSGLTSQGLIDLRSERNRLIALTDWTQMGDIPQAARDSWKVYRQALRDITSSATSLNDVTWPTKPS